MNGQKSDFKNYVKNSCANNGNYWVFVLAGFTIAMAFKLWTRLHAKGYGHKTAMLLLSAKNSIRLFFYFLQKTIMMAGASFIPKKLAYIRFA